MGKINAYVPMDERNTFANPTTKPLKSAMDGYQENIKSVPEQIHLKLKTAAKLLKEIFIINDRSEHKPHSSKVHAHFDALNKDLDFVKNALKKDPYKLHNSKLAIDLSWIQEMKMVCEAIKKSVVDMLEVKKLGKLESTLTGLQHLLEQQKEAHVSKKGETKKKVASKPAKKTVAATKSPTKAKKAVKAKTVAKAKPAVKAKTAAKPVVKAKTVAKAKTVVKAKSVPKKAKPAVKASAAKPKTAKPVTKVSSKNLASSKLKTKTAAKGPSRPMK